MAGELGKGEALEFQDIFVFSRPIVRYLPSKGKVQLALRASES